MHHNFNNTRIERIRFEPVDGGPQMGARKDHDAAYKYIYIWDSLGDRQAASQSVSQ